ncbi:efflux RND transporter periplasmic adaptor subunit [Vibrio agarivorans]|uniref:efflux RND transporter periplasmic adaptor subunit n=1 Tax=Vibrio agarivorans TaxID=153622 RepID=UPI0025B3A177|nr:efflux RND transporter periplasmic adaptor subunit [Vibrio agarivorans]MDN3659910.1 efflux RND transporter periplasmic adaptor subunit [Vibrio agarivorans]
MKKYALIVGVITLAGFTAFSLHTSEKEEPAVSSALTVDTTFSQQQTLQRSVHMLGNTFAHQSIEIQPEDKGRITQVLVQSGQKVSQGQLLFALDDRHQQAAVNREQANLKEIERQYNNLLRLLPNGAVTQADVDAALANVEMQQAELDIAKANLEDKQVTAPFTGQLGLVDVSIGQNVESDTVLTTLDDPRQLRLNVAIPAPYLRQLAIGQSTYLSSVEDSTRVKATLKSLDGRVSNQTQSIQAQFLIDNDELGLTPGSLVMGELTLPSEVEITIPLQSVVYRGHQRYVYVVHDNTVEQRPVTLGERTGEQVQVISGLDLGEEIVYRGTVKLRDGAEIEIIETLDAQVTQGER